MRNSLKEVLMERDGLSEVEAQEQIEMFKQSVEEDILCEDFLAIEEAMLSDFGLEPDYIEDILFG